MGGAAEVKGWGVEELMECGGVDVVGGFGEFECCMLPEGGDIGRLKWTVFGCSVCALCLVITVLGEVGRFTLEDGGEVGRFLEGETDRFRCAILCFRGELWRCRLGVIGFVPVGEVGRFEKPPTSLLLEFGAIATLSSSKTVSEGTFKCVVAVVGSV